MKSQTEILKKEEKNEKDQYGAGPSRCFCSEFGLYLC